MLKIKASELRRKPGHLPVISLLPTFDMITELKCYDRFFIKHCKCILVMDSISTPLESAHAAVLYDFQSDKI